VAKEFYVGSSPGKVLSLSDSLFFRRKPLLDFDLEVSNHLALSLGDKRI
jgi:hypothetical protein